MITQVTKNPKTDRRKKTLLQPCYNIDDIYKEYKLEKKHKQSKNIISKSLFKEICFTFNKILCKKILEGIVFVLPYRLGELGITKRKMSYKERELKVDFGHFNKTKELTHFVNEHSDSYRARWQWRKKNCRVINKRMYSFTPTMSNKRALSKIMLQPNGYTMFLNSNKTM